MSTLKSKIKQKSIDSICDTGVNRLVVIYSIFLSFFVNVLWSCITCKIYDQIYGGILFCMSIISFSFTLIYLLKILRKLQPLEFDYATDSSIDKKRRKLHAFFDKEGKMMMQGYSSYRETIFYKNKMPWKYILLWLFTALSVVMFVFTGIEIANVTNEKNEAAVEHINLRAAEIDSTIEYIRHKIDKTERLTDSLNHYRELYISLGHKQDISNKNNKSTFKIK